MSAANLNREDLEAMFKDIVGKGTADILERTRAAAKEDLASAIADMEARNQGRLIDQVRRNGGKVDDKEEAGLDAGRYLRAFAAGLHRKTSPINVAKEWAKSDRGFESTVRAMEAQDAEKGGFMIPEPLLDGITDILRAQVIVEASGVSYVPLTHGNVSMNYKQTSSTATHIGERAVIPLSNPTLGRMNLSAKKLAARVIVSKDLLRFTSGEADAFVRNDLVDTAAIRKDLALLRDNGGESAPKGMRWLALPANVVDRTLDGGAATLATVTNDLANACERLDTLNIPMRRGAWMMSPRTYWFLYKLRDGLGNQVFRQEMSSGTLFGYPFRKSTNVPNNLNTAGDESEIYLADFDSIVVGDAYGIELSASDVGEGFPTDDVHVKAVLGYDINARHRGAEIAVISAVDWGAP